MRNRKIDFGREIIKIRYSRKLEVGEQAMVYFYTNKNSYNQMFDYNSACYR